MPSPLLPDDMRWVRNLSERADVRVMEVERGGDRWVVRVGPASEGETRTELALLASVRHPRVAPLVDHGPTPDGGLYLARPFIEGDSLLAWSQQQSRDAILACVVRLVDPLVALHRAGYVHGDLKPENVIVQPDGTPILVDFGLAARVGEGSEAGTPFYVAPEVLTGGPHSSASDAFSFGVLLQRLVRPTSTSAREFYADFPTRPFLDALGLEIESLPESIRDLVIGLTARRADRRLSLATAGHRLAERIGCEPPEDAFAPWILPDLLGREHWFNESLSSVGSESPVHSWWSAPNPSDALALFRGLHLALSLRGAGELAIELRSFSEQTSPASLARSLEALEPRLSGVTAIHVESLEPWSLRVLELLTGLAANAPACTATIVVSAHGSPGDSWRESLVPAMDLGELKRFLQGQSSGDPSVLAPRLMEASGGTLDGLSRVLRTAAERGVLLSTSAGWDLTEGPTLFDAEAHNEDLGTGPENDVLVAIGLAKRSLSLSELEDLLDLGSEELVATVARTTARGWTRLDSDRRLSATVRVDPGSARDPRQLLARVAALLRGHHVEDVRSLALTWASQGIESEPLLKALDEARESGVPERVLEIVDELEVLLELRTPIQEHLDARIELVRIHAWMDLGRMDQAQARLESLRSTNEGPIAGRVALARSRLFELTHQSDLALTTLDQAVRLDPGLEAEAFVQRVFLFGRRGESEVVLKLAEALPESLHTLPARLRWTMASTIAMSRFRRGDIDGAHRALVELRDEIRRSPTPLRVAGVELNLAIVERRAGSLQSAVQHLEAARDAFDGLGDWRGVAHARSTLGGVLRESGELRRALVEIEQAVELRRRLCDARGAIVLEATMALVTAEAGQVARTLQLLQNFHGGARHEVPRSFLALLRATEVESLARIGRFPEATRMPDEAEGADPRALLALARAHWMAGRVALATKLCQRAEALAESLHYGPIVATAQRMLSQLDGSLDAISTHGGPLDELDDALFRLLSSGANMDMAEAESLALELERRGLDARAVRIWMAIASRGDEARAKDARIRGSRLFESVGAELGNDARAALRRHLLSRPDPALSDLRLVEPSNSNSLSPMEIEELVRICDQLLLCDDLSTLLSSVVRGAITLTGAERGFLILEEQGTLHFDLALDSAFGDIARPELETSRSVVLEVLRSGHPIRLSNAANDPQRASQQSVASLELRSILCVPIEIPPVSRGVLLLDHRLRTGAFDDRSEGIASLVAKTAALAIQKVKREDTLRSGEESEPRTPQAPASPATRLLVGNSDPIRRVRDQIARIAKSDLPVLVVGPSGTGKELAARTVFEQSNRAQAPFVAENCAALPASLIESELFGHRKGAFTGAIRDHAGLFERADGGTLFLDEIGELPLELQSRLLRVLENGELRRVGDDQTRSVDVRLIAATNLQLEEEVEAGRFRRDLLYRLDGARLVMPGLDERPEDVPLLVRHFLDLHAKKSGDRRHIAPSVIGALVRRAWPGNVRELRNQVERLCVLSDGPIDDPTLVELSPRARTERRSREVVPLAELERAAILNAIATCQGDKREAAKRLGISRAKIYQRLKEWGTEDEASE